MAAKRTAKNTKAKKPAAKKKVAKKKPAAKPAPQARTKPKPASRRVFHNSNQRAIGATAKSGYARDIMPERVEAAESQGATVPVASENGVQEGRVPPAQRVYAAKYQAVSLAEAQANLMKRSSGEMDIIEGGLDDIATVDEHEDQISKHGSNDFDPLGGEEAQDLEPGAAELLAEEQALAAILATAAPAPIPTAAAPRVATPAPARVNPYITQRTRITLELADGAMSMAAIDVKESKYGVTILLPLQDEGATFIPKPGSEITVVRGDKRWNCFFPGTYFEAPELGVLGIVFVKAEEG